RTQTSRGAARLVTTGLILTIVPGTEALVVAVSIAVWRSLAWRSRLRRTISTRCCPSRPPTPAATLVRSTNAKALPARLRAGRGCLFRITRDLPLLMPLARRGSIRAGGVCPSAVRKKLCRPGSTTRMRRRLSTPPESSERCDEVVDLLAPAGLLHLADAAAAAVGDPGFRDLLVGDR